MIQIETTCALCGDLTSQPLVGGRPRFKGTERATLLDGLDLGHRWRGIRVWTGCGVCAPDLANPVPGLSKAAIRAGYASDAYRQALAARSALPGQPDAFRDNTFYALRDDAMRWFAYATVFARYLSPGAAGRAWAHAAAEPGIAAAAPTRR